MATVVDTNKGHPLPIWQRWAMVLNGCNCPEIEKADWLTRWLVISRACVFNMTVTSGLIGILVAALEGYTNGFHAVLVLIGLVAAHAVNNLVNDWTDVRKGVDTEDYPRAQYSTHPILGGLTTLNGLLKAALFLNIIDAAIMIYLTIAVGPWILFFALLGLALSLGYTGFLKRIGLGELTALVVWGPLMIGGTAYAIAGTFTLNMLWLSLPYGLIVMSVLIGKHIDKLGPDKGVGVHSLPVLIGEKASLRLNQFFFILFYVLVVALVVLQITGPWVLVSFFALPQLRTSWQRYSQPKPASPPEGWTVWPLWYVGWAMYFNRTAGALFVVGMVLNLVVPGLMQMVFG